MSSCALQLRSRTRRWDLRARAGCWTPRASMRAPGLSLAVALIYSRIGLPFARAHFPVQNRLRALGASEWLVQGKNVGASMALGSGIGAELGGGLGSGFGGAVTHDIMAGAYNEKHGINPGDNRARIGHNGLAGGML